MKKEFAINDAVITPTTSGVVKQISELADHFEYLVQFKDGTAAWVHERNLILRPTK